MRQENQNPNIRSLLCLLEKFENFYLEFREHLAYGRAAIPRLSSFAGLCAWFQRQRAEENLLETSSDYVNLTDIVIQKNL